MVDKKKTKSTTKTPKVIIQSENDKFNSLNSVNVFDTDCIITFKNSLDDIIKYEQEHPMWAPPSIGSLLNQSNVIESNEYTPFTSTFFATSSINNSTFDNFNHHDTTTHNMISTSAINHKIEELNNSIILTNQSMCQSVCFWCSFDFNSKPIHIPLKEVRIKNEFKHYEGFGNFCCVECAVAYLLNDNDITESIRFQRLHLINYIYKPILGYDVNSPIIPAPNPRFLTKKFGGTLTIDEYRHLINHETQLIQTTKPIFPTLPNITTVSTITSD